MALTLTAETETNAAKRARVLARLQEPDAATVSQRVLARELGVTQPYICKLRRLLTADAAEAPAEPSSASVPFVSKWRKAQTVVGTKKEIENNRAAGIPDDDASGPDNEPALLTRVDASHDERLRTHERLVAMGASYPYNDPLWQPRRG